MVKPNGMENIFITLVKMSSRERERLQNRPFKKLLPISHSIILLLAPKVTVGWRTSTEKMMRTDKRRAMI